MQDAIQQQIFSHEPWSTGDSHQSSSFLKDYTLWRGHMMEQFVKNCCSWEGPTLEQFVKKCLMWESPWAETVELYKEGVTKLQINCNFCSLCSCTAREEEAEES